MTDWILGLFIGAAIVSGVIAWVWVVFHIAENDLCRLIELPPDKPLWTEKTQKMIDETQRMGEEMMKSVRRMKEESPDYKALYYELIMAVARAYPGETRHQTALRYIQQAETMTSGEASKSEKKP